MTRETLKNSSGVAVIAEQGESSVSTFTFYDTADPQATLAKAAIVTLQATLTDASGTVINSRDDQSVLDANGGRLSTAGVLTLKLGPLDNIIVGTVAFGENESHSLLLQWTWVDGDGDTMTGRKEYEVLVRKVARA